MERINKNQNLTGNLIAPPPDREEFERVIHGLFKNGDLGNFARLLQKDQSQISRELNPFEPQYVSRFYQTVLGLWAMDCIRSGMGDTVLTKINLEREKWLGEDVVIMQPAAELSTNIGKQLMELLEAEMSGKPIDKQIDECVDVINAATKKKAALIAEKARQRSNGAVAAFRRAK